MAGPESTSHRDTRRAMEQVLSAEREIEARVLAVQQHWAGRIQEAAAHAARIAHRTEERIIALHSRCASALEAEIARLEAGAGASAEGAGSYEEHLAQVIERVGTWLTAQPDELE